MSPTTGLAASLIEAGASGYAAAAAGRLVEDRAEIAESFGGGAFRRWKDHLTVRLRELAAALVVAEPDLFVADVVWSRASFEAREMPLGHLRTSLEDLSEILAEELPEGSREAPLAYLRAAQEALAASPAPVAVAETGDGPAEKLTLEYLEAALSGDRRRALDGLMAAVDGGLAAETVHQQVLMTAQRRVGEMWHRWEISVPQEHVVSATTRAAMSLLANRFEVSAPKNKTVLVAVVPGNGHEIAAQALADFFERDGWRAVYLGGELPAADLALAAEVFEADLLALSIALSTHVRATLEVVRKVRSRREETRILLGGGVLTRAPDLWRKLGGDGSAAGFAEALRLGDELTS